MQCSERWLWLPHTTSCSEQDRHTCNASANGSALSLHMWASLAQWRVVRKN